MKERMISHQTTFPEKEKLFKCEIFLNSFGEKKLSNRQQRFAHENEKPFKCKICLNCSGEKNKMNQHQKADHENEEPFKCEICQKCLYLGY